MVTTEQSMPQDSAGALYAQSVFYQQFNDVDFYVEDPEQERFYFQILKKLFPEIKLTKICPLGGKPHLIARATNEPEADRISVYLADKDFDDIIGELKVIEGLFYLDRYCIENYLLEEQAIIRFIYSENHKLKDEEIFKKFNYGKEITEINGTLVSLFSVFLIVHQHKLHIKSTGLHPSYFSIENQLAEFDSGKAETVARTAAPVLTKKTSLKLHEELLKVSHLFQKNDLNTPNISGEYILWFLMHRITERFEFANRPSFESIRYRLAEYCEFQSLCSLKKRVDDYIKLRIATLKAK